MTISAQLNQKKDDQNLVLAIFRILDAKIKYADFQLNAFVKSIMIDGQQAHRANLQDSKWIEAQEKVFNTIENSSLHTTKLLFLRANVNKHNSDKILKLITEVDLTQMSLEVIKRRIK